MEGREDEGVEALEGNAAGTTRESADAVAGVVARTLRVRSKGDSGSRGDAPWVAAKEEVEEAEAEAAGACV